MADWLGVDMLHDTDRCTLTRKDGRDCNLPVPQTSPISLCMKHLQEAYLYINDQIQGRMNLLHAARRDREEAERPDPVVYYARIGSHVKIGTTVNLRMRMSAIAAEELLATEPGGVDLERQRHKQFQHLHARRKEYFHPGPDLLAHIRQLRQAAVERAA